MCISYAAIVRYFANVNQMQANNGHVGLGLNGFTEKSGHAHAYQISCQLCDRSELCVMTVERSRGFLQPISYANFN